MKTFSKGSFTCFFEKMVPGWGGVLPDFTRRGTNYLHTTLLKTYLMWVLFFLRRHPAPSRRLTSSECTESGT